MAKKLYGVMKSILEEVRISAVPRFDDELVRVCCQIMAVLWIRHLGRLFCLIVMSDLGIMYRRYL